jgi:hypothetical protein
VELRPAFRVERQQLHHAVRPSTPGRDQFDLGPDQRLFGVQNVFDPADPTNKTLKFKTHEAFGDAAKTADNITEIGDGDPLQDVCSNPAIDQITMAGKNIGDLLNAKGITWGSFMGGFDLTVVNADGTTGCARHTNPTAPGTAAFTSVDYIPHHAWFQYYASTRNPTHARPSSVEPSVTA